MEPPTPVEASIATGLCVITLPLCAYPLLVLWSDREDARQTPQGSNRDTTHGRQMVLWRTVLMSHFILLSFAITTVFEEVCGDGSSADFGWKEGHYTCLRRRFESVADFLEYCTVPIYPLIILSMSLQLRPNLPNQRTQHLLKLLYRGFATCVGILTLTLLFSAMANVMLTWTKDPGYLPLVALGESIYHRTFVLWFGLLVICAMASLGLAMRLIPLIQPTKTAKQLHSSVAILSRIRGASKSNHPSDASLPPLSPVTAVVIGEHASKQGALVALAPGGLDDPLAEDGWARARLLSNSVAMATVHTCVRRLKVLLALITVVLTGNVGMVALGDAVPRVLLRVVGWLSCRVVSVSLFAAVNQVKRSVIAKRRVPNPAVGSLALDSEWHGLTVK